MPKQGSSKEGILISKMEFLESNNLNHWQLYTPLLGYLIIYIGLKIRLREVDSDED